MLNEYTASEYTSRIEGIGFNLQDPKLSLDWIL